MPGVSLQCFKVAETELNPDDERERLGVGRAEGPTSVVAVEGEVGVREEAQALAMRQVLPLRLLFSL